MSSAIDLYVPTAPGGGWWHHHVAWARTRRCRVSLLSLLSLPSLPLSVSLCLSLTHSAGRGCSTTIKVKDAAAGLELVARIQVRQVLLL
jgi:hypothetical protein